MLALSVQQPWAWLIATGRKDVENRIWRTHFRGRFIIHASKRFDRDGYQWLLGQEPSAMRDMGNPAMLGLGGVVGVADLLDCVRAHESRWFQGPYGFVIGNAIETPFVPSRGRLKFFDTPFSEFNLTGERGGARA